jgi:hypothetical protein
MSAQGQKLALRFVPNWSVLGVQADISRGRAFANQIANEPRGTAQYRVAQARTIAAERANESIPLSHRMIRADTNLRTRNPLCGLSAPRVRSPPSPPIPQHWTCSGRGVLQTRCKRFGTALGLASVKIRGSRSVGHWNPTGSIMPLGHPGSVSADALIRSASLLLSPG